MATGTVKWFSDEQAFGFITPDDSGNDLFVFHSAIHGNGFKPLTVGAKVSYDAEQGPEAANVPSAVKLGCLAKRRICGLRSPVVLTLAPGEPDDAGNQPRRPEGGAIPRARRT